MTSAPPTTSTRPATPDRTSARRIRRLLLWLGWISSWLIEHPFSHLRSFLGPVPSRELEQERRSEL